MTAPNELPMVRVLWTDAQGDAHGWTPISQLDNAPCVVTTVGHLVPGRENHVTVALSYHHDNDEMVIDSALHIPLGMVLSTEHLRPA